jgi:hypothetical protein
MFQLDTQTKALARRAFVSNLHDRVSNCEEELSVYDDCAEQNIQPKDVWERAHKAAHGYSITGSLFGMNQVAM